MNCVDLDDFIGGGTAPLDPFGTEGDPYLRTDGGNAMLDVLRAVAGHWQRPGYTFDQERNTGFLLAGAGLLGVTLLGLPAWLWSTTGVSFWVGAFTATFTHANTADRTYTLPDMDATLMAVEQWVFKEEPAGDVDGVNDTFVLDFVPVAGSEHVFKNGLLLDDGYSIVDDTITFDTPPRATPVPTRIRVTYLRSSG